MIWTCLGLLLFTIFTIVVIHRHRKASEKIDGVLTIDGIRYLVGNTDISYVMYKLGSTIQSRYIKTTSFIKISDSEGILTFGGIAYKLGYMNETGDYNINASYRIKCTQCNRDVILDVSFVKSDCSKLSPGKMIMPGPKMNQAYHRFFKEVFDVKVI